MVLVAQPTEDRASLGLLGPRSPRAWEQSPDIVRAAKTERTMRPMRIVMLGILTQEVRQVSSAHDQHVIEHLPSYASDQSLDVRVGQWASIGGEHDPDAFGANTASKVRQYLASRSRSK